MDEKSDILWNIWYEEKPNHTDVFQIMIWWWNMVVRSNEINEHHFPGNLLWLTQPVRTFFNKNLNTNSMKTYHPLKSFVRWSDPQLGGKGVSVDEFMGEFYPGPSCCVGIPTSPRWIGDGQFLNPLGIQWEGRDPMGWNEPEKCHLECKGSAQIHLNPNLVRHWVT